MPPLPPGEIPLAPHRKANPGQIRPYDNADSRLELATLLKHLSPADRLNFLRWVCTLATFPGPQIYSIPIQPSRAMVKLAEEARHCDRANERLTMSVLADVTHLSSDYCLDLDKVVAELVTWVRRPQDRP